MKGDVKKEREIEERLKQLGLFQTKLNFEEDLRSKLEQSIAAADDLTNIIKKTRRRRDQSGASLEGISNIKNIIRPRIIYDERGNKAFYEIKILLGKFKHDVRWKKDFRTVQITSFTNKSLPTFPNLNAKPSMVENRTLQAAVTKQSSGVSQNNVDTARSQISRVNLDKPIAIAAAVPLYLLDGSNDVGWRSDHQLDIKRTLDAHLNISSKGLDHPNTDIVGDKLNGVKPIRNSDELKTSNRFDVGNGINGQLSTDVGLKNSLDFTDRSIRSSYNGIPNNRKIEAKFLNKSATNRILNASPNKGLNTKDSVEKLRVSTDPKIENNAEYNFSSSDIIEANNNLNKASVSITNDRENWTGASDATFGKNASRIHLDNFVKELTIELPDFVDVTSVGIRCTDGVVYITSSVIRV